jgi:hypothetical protein
MSNRRRPSPLAARMQLLAEDAGQRYVHNHESSAWLRGQLDALSHRLQSGKMSACPHLAPGMIGAVALWKPNLAYCGDCTKQMQVHGDADHTCDRCGVVAEAIHPTSRHPRPCCW